MTIWDLCFGPLAWDGVKSTPAGWPPVVMAWLARPPGMGPSGLPNRAPTGGCGTARTVRGYCVSLEGGGGPGGGEATVVRSRVWRSSLCGLERSGDGFPGDLMHSGDSWTIPGAVGRSSPVVRSRGQKT